MRAIDHVNLAQPWQTADEAVLFLTSVFGLSADAPTEVAGTHRAGAQPGDAHRRRRGAVAAQSHPHVLADLPVPRHIAFACTDVFEVATPRP